jgi:membrane-bound inhibitor of C-type lysozyme
MLANSGSGAKYSDKIYLENSKIVVDKTKNRSDMIDDFL